MLAKDIMRKRVITVAPEMTLRELAKLFMDKQITGAPVVDERGKLLGVVSQTDIVRKDREKLPEADIPGYYQHPGDKALYQSGFQIEDPDFTRVSDVMTPAVLSAEEDVPVEQLAQVMLRKHIHRLVITRSGKLCGIVTTTDMLRALLVMLRRSRPRVRA